MQNNKEIETQKSKDTEFPEDATISESFTSSQTADTLEVTEKSTPKSPIDTIYEEREEFIIIGLTGRTGSGCTTVSNILSTESFDDLNLHNPKSTDFENNEQRKYQIIFKYAERHWEPFKVISMTNVIISYLVAVEYTKFETIIKDVFSEDQSLSNAVVSELSKLVLTKDDANALGIDDLMLYNKT